MTDSAKPQPWDSSEVRKLREEIAELRAVAERLERDLEARRQWVELVSRGAAGAFPTWH